MANAIDVVVLEHATVENNHCCMDKGPGYATPLLAMAGPRENLLYVTCIYTGIYIYIFFYRILDF